MKNIVFIVIILVIVIGGGFLYVSRQGKYQLPSTTNNTSLSSNQVTTIPSAKSVLVEVTANNGKLSPNEFRVPLLGTLNLHVNSIDKDYVFKVQGYPRLDTTFKKGVVVTYPINDLGVGEYVFTCGDGCTGKIVVEQQGDDE